MFTGWDYAVCILVLAVSACIGLYYGCTGGKQNTTKEFLMAGRNMGVLPVSMSMLASSMSAITVLGIPAEMYVFGTQYCMVWIGYVIMVPLAAHFFLPVFYNLKLTSVFEYLEMRYDRGIRLIVSIMYIINMIIYLAFSLYTPALALTIVTGLNVWVAVLSVGVVCIFYTALGGMKAVMWTDVFQIGIMFVGLFAILIKGSLDHGGFGNIWKIMEEGDRIQFWDTDPDPRTRHTLWSLGIGSGIFWVACYGVNQALVQRSLCTPSLRTAQVALWLNLPGLIALLIVCSLCGFVVYAQYRDCDPLTRPNHIKKDQLLPLYVIEHLDYPCIPGLFTASVFSGSLSSISSVLNALATVALQDMVRPYCLPKMKDSAAANVSKGIAVGFGALMILLTYVASHLGGVMQAVIGVMGMISGPMLGLFVLAMTNPWCNKKGAYGGYLTGLVATSWLGIGAFIYKPYVYKPPVSLSECPVGNITYVTPMYLNDSTTTAATSRPEDRAGYLGFYEISYLWYTLFGAIVVIVVGTIVSLLTGAADPNDVDPKLLTPVVKSFFCCLPAQFRRAIQRNINRSLDDGDVDPMSTSSTYKKCPTDEAFSTDTQM